MLNKLLRFSRFKKLPGVVTADGTFGETLVYHPTLSGLRGVWLDKGILQITNIYNYCRRKLVVFEIF